MNNYVSSYLLWELDMIRLTPAPVMLPAYTTIYVRSLSDVTSSAGQRLSEFLSRLPLYAVRDGMIRQVLSEEARQLFTQLDQLASQKQTAIEEHQFELAARFRDEQYELLAKLKRLVLNPIPIQPGHIIQLLRELGFNGALPTPQDST